MYPSLARLCQMCARSADRCCYTVVPDILDLCLSWLMYRSGRHGCVVLKGYRFAAHFRYTTGLVVFSLCRLVMPPWGYMPIMTCRARCAFALLIAVDIRLYHIVYAFAWMIAVTMPLWSTRLCRPEALSLCCSLFICGCASCIFALLKNRGRGCA